MKDGLLSIELKREIPEAMKPKKINIGGSQQGQIGADQPASKQTVDAEAEDENRSAICAKGIGRGFQPCQAQGQSFSTALETTNANSK